MNLVLSVLPEPESPLTRMVWSLCSVCVGGACRLHSQIGLRHAPQPYNLCLRERRGAEGRGASS